MQGQTLTGHPGTWTHDLAEISFAYQWERCDAAGANCVDLTGKTASTLTLSAADVGHTIRLRVTATESAAPAPSSSYFDEDWSSGQFSSARWTYLNVYESPGYINATTSGSPSGRVSVVNDPAGGGGKAARCEIRDSDPGWASNPDVDKEEIATDTQRTFNEGAGGIPYGGVRWFSVDVYLPYGAEKFEWAHGGSQPYFSLIGFHPPGGTGWSAFHLGWEAFQVVGGDANIYLNFHVEGGTFPESTYSEIINLLQLTDGAAARVLTNHNRWVNITWGMKFNPDNSGWLEAWVDGVNVYPRKNRPTMWAGHNASYFKYGLYCKHDASFPITGRSVIYFGRTQMSLTKP